MAGKIRESTTQAIRFGPFLDETDGRTPETGLTITISDMRLSKNGGPFATKGDAGNATHDSDGWYFTNLTAADTDTTGIMIMNVDVSGALPVWVEWQVVTQEKYDADYSSTATGPVQPTTPGNTLDITATGAAGIDWGNVENPATANNLSSTTVNLVNTTTTNTDMRGTDNALLASSAPTNWSSMVVSGAGAVDSLVQGYLNTTLTESSAGRINNNIEFFFDNNDAQTAQVVDDVGGGGGGLTQQQVRDAMKLSPTAGAPDSGSIDEHLDDILTDTSVTIPNQISGLNNFDPSSDQVIVATNNDKAGYSISGTKTTLDALNDISVSDVLTTQMIEDYAADGVAPTLAQALFLIQQTIGDFSISGTTITARKLDGSTTAATYTLDDGTNPTSRTRST